MRGILIRLAVAFAAIFVGNAASAQDNAACDAACPVPCYFGVCSPAQATYKRAFERCDMRQLQAVVDLYGGTAAATKASDALSKLRARGYATSRIGVSPNTGGQSCASILGEVGGGTGGGGDACSNVTVPAGFRCIVQNGAAVVVQDTTAPVPRPAQSRQHPRPPPLRWRGGAGIRCLSRREGCGLL